MPASAGQYVLRGTPIAELADTTSLRAILPVVADAVSDEVNRDFQQLVANLQLAYATAAQRP